MHPSQSPRTFAVASLAALFVFLAAGCDSVISGGGGGSSTPDPGPGEAPVFAAQLAVVDEAGGPIENATLEIDGASLARTAAAEGGLYTLPELRGPAVIVVRAPGKLPEPVVVDRRDTALRTVKLFNRTGTGGARRIAMHFGGDVMLGRRYVEPTRAGTAVVDDTDDGTSARAVVQHLAPLFRAADLRSVNVETVIGTFTLEEAYPKKRFLLQSPPQTVHLLDELGVNLVTLGNNHARDWLDAGVQATMDALDDAGFAHVGGGTTPAEARLPRWLDMAGFRLGFLSYTSVNGDFVNDNLPRDADPAPDPIPESEAWQYEQRSFGFVGATVNIATEARRIGEAWRLIKNAEAGAGDSEIASLWSAAVDVYPELQDWVARRGHGGANPYDPATIATDIATLRAVGCDLVVVQFHSGFQFFEVKSSFVESASHAAIDNGADLVVNHHPHVLQGFEWYKDKLIAYSLGNFVFDQDFLATFPSLVLRVIFEETTPIEVRVLPVMLDNYYPKPIGGDAATRVVQMLYERSVLPFRSERVSGHVHHVFRLPGTDVVEPSFTLNGASALITQGAASRVPSTVYLLDGSVHALSGAQLVRTRSYGGGALSGVELGRDLFLWGSFDDMGADGVGSGGVHWAATETHKRVEVIDAAPSTHRALVLRRRASNTSRTLVRPVARTPFRRNRFYTVGGSVAMPIDGDATYSLRLRARLTGTGQPQVRFDVYHFDDTNPTADPESALLRRREYDLDIPADDQWHEMTFDLPSTLLEEAGGLEANMHMFYLGLTPPSSGDATLTVDDVEFVEWRAAEDLPDIFYGARLLRTADVDRTVTIETIGS